ncbi:hypothetical protein AYO41_00670 [Verrucomicrobia bacterium SCGC AG-212-E04]|nr:hypothetical protein AYO41_00670 [Verrucomicrobia bacterium SCGC AG-212-E04]
MKASSFGALLCASLFASPSSVFAQGPLTPPPGPPAPTMKSLDQIEARTPISTAPFTISAPGSYYLTKNISVTSGDAIVIAVGGVTLDLNGFTISSSEASPSGYGINLNNGVSGIVISNGIIRGNVTYSGGVYSGPGFAYGVGFSVSTPLNVRVTNLVVSGCKVDGINLGTDFASTSAERCSVRTVGSGGIVAGAVNDCTAYFCGGNGINCTVVANSIGRSTGTGRGISTITAVNCFADSVDNNAISADTAQSCRGGNSGDLPAIDASLVINCHGINTGSGSGIAGATVSQSYGISTGGGYGISAAHAVLNSYGSGLSGGITTFNGTAENCRGETANGIGIQAFAAQNCFGNASGNGTGLSAYVISNCIGGSNTGIGIHCDIAGAMSYAFRQSPVGSNYLLGGGLAGPFNLP